MCPRPLGTPREASSSCPGCLRKVDCEVAPKVQGNSIPGGKGGNDSPHFVGIAGGVLLGPPELHTPFGKWMLVQASPSGPTVPRPQAVPSLSASPFQASPTLTPSAFPYAGPVALWFWNVPCIVLALRHHRADSGSGPGSGQVPRACVRGEGIGRRGAKSSVSPALCRLRNSTKTALGPSTGSDIP